MNPLELCALETCYKSKTLDSTEPKQKMKTKNSNFHLFISGDDINANMEILHLF